MSGESSLSCDDPGSLTCFKYRTGATALKCLVEGVIYFASPKELNDPLEAKFDLSDSRQSWEQLTATINELAASRLSAERIDPSLPPEEYGAAHTTENAKFYEACQGIGVYSMAARPDNQSMWAYYCDNSRGVCLELAWPKELMESQQLWPVDVRYTDQARQINRAEDAHLLLKELADENPNWSIGQLTAFSMTDQYRRRLGVRSVARATSMKHSHWRHESEIRILASRPGPRPLLKEILKKVYFLRTDFPEWGAIMATLYQFYPGVELAQISFHHNNPLTRVQEQEFRFVHLSEVN
jgi:hypothetical protein